MSTGLVVTTPPPDLVVVPDDVAAHLRLDDIEAEQVNLRHYISAATDLVQKRTNRTLPTTVYELSLDAFPSCAIELPLPPLQSVDEITYIDPDGASQVLDPGAYQVDTRTEPGRVAPVAGGTWPATATGTAAAVVVKFTAGYATLPPALHQAVLFLVGTWWENRENVVLGVTATSLPFTVESLLDSYTLHVLP